MSEAQSIWSKKPFGSKASEYVEKDWSIIPLPAEKKDPPPVGFTGATGEIPDGDKIAEWLLDERKCKGNIAIRAGNVVVIEGVRYEVIGIDVDDYAEKTGRLDLSRLESRFGELPSTWISTSRGDGSSGIRWFRVPAGYAFIGSASQSIEIVQRRHRYGVVFPSWHPEGRQYVWYRPGVSLDGVSFVNEIPKVVDLPVLTDGWLDYLTRQRQTDLESDPYGKDMDIRNDALIAWATEQFVNPDSMCGHMASRVEAWLKEIEDSPTNHDKIVAAHWNLMCVAAEGHSGVNVAIAEVETYWKADCLARRKRSLKSAIAEVRRSYLGGLRRVKAKWNAYEAQGMLLFYGETCLGVGEIAPDGDDGDGWVAQIPWEYKRFDPADYEKNDVGQANHLLDRVGDNLRYLHDYNAWLLFDGKTWHIDEFAQIRKLFHMCCVKTSLKRAKGLRKRLQEHHDSGGTPSDTQSAKYVAQIKKLEYIALHYGNDSKVRAVLNCLKSLDNVSMRFNELNWDMDILAMPNGKVLRLSEPSRPLDGAAVGFTVEENEKRYYTTFSTAVEYVPLKGQVEDESPYLAQAEKWKGYLDLFLPDPEYRAFVQKALGHMVIGGNPEKLAIFLVGQRGTGKSTMLLAIQACLGDYASTFQPNAIFKDSGTGNNPELGNLLHKRVICSSESGSQRIHANPLKRNTGGDKISVTRKYANDQIIGVPHFITLVSTNYPPTIEDADEALRKRIMVLPFEIQVSGDNDDKRADVTIARECRHAVLAWLMFGYKRYVREGLDYGTWHTLAQAATKDFGAQLSDVSTFLNEYCVVAPDDVRHVLDKANYNPLIPEYVALMRQWSRVTLSQLFSIYQTEGEGSIPLGKIKFRRKVERAGVWVDTRKIDGDLATRFIGLQWKNSDTMSHLKG